MFILYLFLILPSFLFLASLVVVGFGEYFVDFLLELGMVVVAFDRLPIHIKSLTRFTFCCGL